jgi:hypothetical protein
MNSDQGIEIKTANPQPDPTLVKLKMILTSHVVSIDEWIGYLKGMSELGRKTLAAGDSEERYANALHVISPIGIAMTAVHTIQEKIITGQDLQGDIYQALINELQTTYNAVIDKSSEEFKKKLEI